MRQYPDELYHFGIKGMKWGVRRNRKGGGLTHKALKKYGENERAKTEYWSKRLDTSGEPPVKVRGPISAIGYGSAKLMSGKMTRSYKRQQKVNKLVNAEHRMTPSDRRKSRLKSAAKIAGIAAGVGALTYGAKQGKWHMMNRAIDKTLGSGARDVLPQVFSGGALSGYKDASRLVRKINAKKAVKSAVGTAAVLGAFHGARRLNAEAMYKSRSLGRKKTKKRK